jgi:phosphoglycerate dehydrogenase-like enzyme
VNCSRGPVIDEVALVEHLKENPMFRVGLDVFEVTSIRSASLNLIHCQKKTMFKLIYDSSNIVIVLG